MDSKWDEYKKILKIIGEYYPKECAFISQEYLASKEYKKYKRIINDAGLFRQKEKEYYDKFDIFSILCETLGQYDISMFSVFSFAA